jgi:transcriptional regulator with XRE-family HTH domain
MEIAGRLAALRARDGLSPEELAGRLGVERDAVLKWESGEDSPNPDQLAALADLYQVPPEELKTSEPDEGDADAPEPGDEDEARDSGIWRFQKPDGRLDLVKFPYPVAVTMVYLLIGFLFNLWHPGWLLFMTIPVYYTAISPKGGFDLNRVPYPLLVSILYLVAGFAVNFWHPGWLVFLTIPLYYTLAGRVIREKLNRVLVELMLVGIVYLIGAALGHQFRFWLLIPALAFIAVVALRDRRH